MQKAQALDQKAKLQMSSYVKKHIITRKQQIICQNVLFSESNIYTAILQSHDWATQSPNVHLQSEVAPDIPSLTLALASEIRCQQMMLTYLPATEYEHMF